jgi:ubiquinol-cytochrome c reductase cytochrome b subunit
VVGKDKAAEAPRAGSVDGGDAGTLPEGSLQPAE